MRTVNGAAHWEEKTMSKFARARALVPLRIFAGAAVGALLAASAASAQDVKAVPRNETLVLTPWGDQPAQLANVDNWNPYLTTVTHQRDAMQFTVNEELFYTNLNDGKLIPWQAESFDLSKDFLTATIKLRKGVEWSDGQPFTSDDVKFTLEALRDAPAEINGSSDYKEYIKSVDTPDPLTAVIAFTKPAPRWVRDHLALGHENHYPILPAHIWKGQDIKAFTNFDLAKGLPVGTGAYKLVSSTNQQEVFDRRDDWWGAKTGFMPLARAQAHRHRSRRQRRRDGATADRQPGRWRPAAARGHIRSRAGAEPKTAFLERTGAGVGRARWLRLFAGLQ